VRNELLLTIAKNKEAARYVANAVSSNFDKLPESTRNEIRKLGNNRENSDGAST
jgi:hypothetical protein